MTVKQIYKMIFAISDYYQYKKRSGRYSHDEYISDGWLQANIENFPSPEKYPPAETLIVSTMESFTSWLVMFYTNTKASHVAILDGKGNVIDCTTSGIIKHPFTDYLDNISYLMVLSPPPPVSEKREFVIREAEKHIGEPYGWLTLFVLFLQRISGIHSRFTWKYVFDFISVFAILIAIFYKFYFIKLLSMFMALAYLAVVCFNRTVAKITT